MSRINNTIKTEGDTTTILITKNDDQSYLKEVIIDTEDLPKLGKCHCKNTSYVWTNGNNICHTILGHASNMDNVVDHINGNKLDNRKQNLRFCSNSQNAANAKLNLRNKSGHKGVYWFKSANRWRAEIKVLGKKKYLGTFTEVDRAAAAYNTAAEKYFGEFSNKELVGVSK